MSEILLRISKSISALFNQALLSDSSRFPMLIKPPRPGNQQPRAERADRELVRARGRWTERCEGVDRQKENDKTTEGVRAGLVLRFRFSRINPDSNHEHRQFDRNHEPAVIPKCQSELATAGIQRQVRPVHNVIQKPVTYDTDPDDDRANYVTRDTEIECR